MRVLIAGDTHASPTAAIDLIHMARHYEVDAIWQCGDFGWWPMRSEYNYFIDRLTSDLPVPLYFADGNHEDHSMLDHDSDEPYEVATNIFHVPRGVVMTPQTDRRVMFFGGARSVDRTYRKEGVSWFPEELPNHSQWERAFSSDLVDIVIAHDSPIWVEYGYPPHWLADWPIEDLLVSENFRTQLADLAESLYPTYWFNGHHHRLVIAEKDGVEVFSLAESGHRIDQWTLLLDLDTMQITYHGH